MEEEHESRVDERLSTSPFSPDEIAQSTRFQDVQWDSEGRNLIWLEGRSDRSILVRWHEGHRRDLTRDIHVRAGVGYGGGDFSVRQKKVYFVSDGKIYHQSTEALERDLVLKSGSEITSPDLSPNGNWILFIEGSPRKDRLMIAPSDGGTPVCLTEESDFLMQPHWHPNSRAVAWVSWDHPHMPWQESRVHLASLDFQGFEPVLDSHRLLNERGACFQPQFSPDGSKIAFVTDAGGWFNLQVRELEHFSLLATLEEEAEHAPPAWIQGLRSFGWTSDSSKIFLIRTQQGFEKLMVYDLKEGHYEEFSPGLSDYTALRQISVDRQTDRVALIASSPTIPDRILTVAEGEGPRILHRSTPELIARDAHSRPQPVSFDGPGKSVHGLYYPPKPSPPGPAALIIKIHGGPTSHELAQYDADVQFFTSRGFAFLSLNYRGSSGYGRSYREALDQAWGVADVEDVHLAAANLKDRDEIDADRVVLLGGSAGGYTLLWSLIRYPHFYRAGICRYPVADLLDLTEKTHKFERHYLDSLVGPMPESEDRYQERSPLTCVDQIVDPLAVFQGKEDRVVPPRQSQSLSDSLVRRGVPHHYRVFEGEGHGWKKEETIRTYYQDICRFLARHVLNDT